MLINQSIGWSIEIPKGWDLMPAVNTGKLVGEATWVDSQGTAHANSTQWLIGFRKSENDLFYSFYERNNPYLSKEHLVDLMAEQRATASEMFPRNYKVVNMSPIV